MIIIYKLNNIIEYNSISIYNIDDTIANYSHLHSATPNKNNVVHGIRTFVFNDKAVKKKKLHNVEKNTQLIPQISQDTIECDL